MTNRNPTENFNQVSFFGHLVPRSCLSLRCPDLPVCSPVCESLQHLLFFVQPSPWVGCSLGYLCIPMQFFLAKTRVLTCWAWNSSVPYVPASPDPRLPRPMSPMPQVPMPSQHMHQRPEKNHSPSTLGVSSLNALSADMSCTGTLTLPSKAVKMTTPAPLALPSILDSSPPTPPLFPLAPQ